MAQQNINELAETGTEQEQNNQSYTPKWDEYSREMYPFLSISNLEATICRSRKKG